MSYEINKIQSEFQEIKNIIETHKSRAYQAVNQEMIITNWEIGKYVSGKIKSSEWGSKIVSQLAEYLQEEKPRSDGYNKRSIYRMVKFYDTYSSNEFMTTALSQIELPNNQDIRIVTTMLTQLEETKLLSILSLINWSSHLEIITGCTSVEEMIFYILLAHKEKLNVRELRRQIESSVYERSLLGDKKKSLRLIETYPTAYSVFKDSYMVDYLDLPEVHSEKSLQNGLIQHMKKFILDLGKDFIFMGEEYPVKVGMSDFKIDLLFFHRGLQCIIALELKSNKFKPEYLGQLEFYLEALDRDVKNENENPSIGILLCKQVDVEVVEYALSRSMSPSMVAKYNQKLLPKEELRKHLNEYLNTTELLE